MSINKYNMINPTPNNNSEIVISTDNRINNQSIDEITHIYRMKMVSGSVLNKKIKYNNPDDFDKIIKCYTNDPFIKIKTDTIVLDYKSSKYLRVQFNAPKSLGTVIGYIYIENQSQEIKGKSELEEVLKFVIEIDK